MPLFLYPRLFCPNPPRLSVYLPPPFGPQQVRDYRWPQEEAVRCLLPRGAAGRDGPEGRGNVRHPLRHRPQLP